MPGLSKTSKFLLSDATIMIGPCADVFDLTPEAHSVGLTKRVNANTDMGYVELTQGVTQTVVYTVNNSVRSTITAEIYEYTARNLAYGAGIDASGVAYDDHDTSYALADAHDDTDTTVTLATGAGANFAAGDFLVMQQNEGDVVAVIKVGSVASDVITPASGYGLPADVDWAVATTRVFRVRNPLKVGTQTADGLLGCKLVGLLPENQKPIIMIFPKVRITKGLSVAFQTDNFANMPFEIMPYALLPTDSFYSDFAGNKTHMILKG